MMKDYLKPHKLPAVYLDKQKRFVHKKIVQHVSKGQ